MALQTAQEAALVLEKFFDKRVELARDDFNIALLMGEIRRHFLTVGEVVLNESFLEMAALNLGGNLHYLANADTVSRIEQVSRQTKELQQRLDAEKREKDRAARELLRTQERQARQDAHRPGVSSAYGSGAKDVAAAEGKERQAAQKVALIAAEHSAMLAELEAIESYLATNVSGILWGKTNDVKAQKKAALRLKFPKFASEIR